MKLLLKNMKKVTKIALAVFTGSFVCLTWIYQWKQWKSYLFTNVNYIPANSHALGVSFTPVGWKLRSHAGSRLRANFSRLIEKCELLPSCLTQFQKCVNSDPCKERKPCVKWINNNTFLAISDFWSEKQVKTSPSTDFGRLQKTSRTSSEDLRTSSGIFGNDRVVFKNPSTPRIKISHLYLRKSWQV